MSDQVRQPYPIMQARFLKSEVFAGFLILSRSMEVVSKGNKKILRLLFFYFFCLSPQFRGIHSQKPFVFVRSYFPSPELLHSIAGYASAYDEEGAYFETVSHTSCGSFFFFSP